ncbi:MAG TPA: Fe-S cluster assembly protein SufD [Pyrinomonadaceae bacterium]|nr:Fe-S cluster assembly protein SufD [Pyrinomonadaceae bacterium]
MATQLIKDQNVYSPAFRVAMLQRETTEPSWLSRLREDSFEKFERTGFPVVQQEEWKYTNVAAIAKTNFAPVLSRNGTRPDSDWLASFSYEETRNSTAVFLNGIFQTDLSSLTALPGDVVAIELGEALLSGQHGESVRKLLESGIHSAENGFTTLNTALFSSGLFLKIPRGQRIERPIHLLFIGQSGHKDALPAAFPRIVIVGEENSSATMIESYASPDDDVYLTNAIVDVRLGSGARFEHYKVQRESPNAFHVATTSADLGPNATYDATTINFGAALSRHDIDVRMDHEGAECSVDGLYMIDGAQHTDTHSIIDHRQPRCRSQQLYKGILDGKSRAVFNGKVFVRHGAQQTDARQTNKNLLLSKEARVDTKPQLEIFADDVKCTHGAAIGQLEEDELFYLESRGIRPELARNLLTYGFAEEVIEKIKIASVRQELDAAVLNRLHVDLEVG